MRKVMFVAWPLGLVVPGAHAEGQAVFNVPVGARGPAFARLRFYLDQLVGNWVDRWMNRG